MNIKNFPTGRVVKAQTGYNSFIPNPLPPEIEWDSSLANALSRADYILGMLAQEGARLPDPHLFIRPFIAREAILSSRIEGTEATLAELLEQEAGGQIEGNLDDLQEVNNYIEALVPSF